jgi:trimeric autotransporter adhesin
MESNRSYSEIDLFQTRKARRTGVPRYLAVILSIFLVFQPFAAFSVTVFDLDYVVAGLNVEDVLVEDFLPDLNVDNVDGGAAFIAQAADPSVADLGLGERGVARVFQTGADNDATIDQVGEGTFVFVQQDDTGTVPGLNNVAVVDQVSLSNAVDDAIVLFQSGDANDATLKSYGSGNRILARQTGDGNIVQVNQGNADQMLAAQNNVALVVQKGDRNSATIGQDGSSNAAFVNQSGVHLMAELGEGEIAFLDLPSDDNTASISQIGYANRAGINQAGTFNTASIIQDGYNNKALINQTGGVLVNEPPQGDPIIWDITPPGPEPGELPEIALLGSHNNHGFIEQIGFDNIAGIFQAGENNEASIFQDGIGNEATVDQRGIGNFADISQIGDGNFVELRQLNDNNSISVSQTGSGNVLSLTQGGGINGGTIFQP